MQIVVRLNPSIGGDFMKSTLRKIGNSKGVIIPRTLIEQYELYEEVELVSTPEGVLLKKAKKVREGWEEDAKSMAASGEDHSVWTDIHDDDWQGDW